MLKQDEQKKIITATTENLKQVKLEGGKLEREKKLNEPKSDDLAVGWYGKKDVKIYTVYCRCGNNKFLQAQNGFRCLSCGRFHSHESWMRQKIKIANAKFHFNDIDKCPHYVVQSLSRRIIKVPIKKTNTNFNNESRVGISALRPKTQRTGAESRTPPSPTVN